MKKLKEFFKNNFLILKIRNRFGPDVQIKQRQLFHYYQERARNGTLPPLRETGFKVFSQFEEDGKLLYIFSVIGMDNKTFVEIGSDDGLNSNCANLVFNFGWRGLFIDGNPAGVQRGERFYAKYPTPFHYPPKFTCAKVNAENINQLLQAKGMTGEISLLSIDIDGNDYWVWNALTVADPKVVIIETHNEFGLENIVVPYDPNYFYPGKHPLYHGASPIAMVNLGRKKGYRLVGANELGFNFIFVKNGIADEFIPEVSVESVLQHPSVWEGQKGFEEIRNWEYVRG
ncbi:MAG: hypothetical protein H7257_11700 [Taibaiella sp.]|nr:hypothetical protein [Taibaiella sp.]